MDNQRIILWGLFASLAFVTYTQFQIETQPPAVTEPETVTAPATAAAPADVTASPSLPPDVGLPAPTATASASSQAPLPAAPDTANAAPGAANIVVETDVLRIEISRVGGALVRAELLKYPIDKTNPDNPVVLLNETPLTRYTLDSGLIDTERGGPTHEAILTAPADRYELSSDSDTLSVPLTWSANGVEVTKTYTFKRGRYDIDLNYAVINRSAVDWNALSYVRISRVHIPPDRSMFDVDSYSFIGPVYYDTEKYEKLDPEDLADEPLDVTVKGGWIASLQHHFVSAVVPVADRAFRYDAGFSNGTVVVRASGTEWRTISAGAQGNFSAKLFVGPKNQENLEDTADGLALTVDYGILAILARPLFWLLQQVHNFVGNWGWSIIIVTFLIKLAFYKLTEASGRSMAKMRKLQPRLKALQERYKDDRQQLSQQMMELYKREKVNPAAGCLPMLIQIPFFIAFYWVLLESVEMRQAPFALWITDLSSKDPYFVLPLLMGAAMFIQQKLNPAPPDPVQAKVMMFLPVMFTAFFAFFPSGLVLYWLTNSVLSVLQQWNINRKMHAD
ncbi:MAG: membrane protein insertase YidC [Gammaproteobacteria bacterium]|nr:membrane protein insertase YidC [Gammaproteobacteria bacterium]NND54336.1 membrane protein insertase YidC [Gammaproteobacteria bacterium]